MSHQAGVAPIAAVVAVKRAMISVAAAANRFVAADFGAGCQVAGPHAGKAEGRCGAGGCGASTP